MKDEEKRQVMKLFNWLLFGLSVVYAIQVIGQLILTVIHRTAGWFEWTLVLAAEVGVISSFLAPILWRCKEISTKQYNYWSVINFSLWLVWIIASAVWVYFS